MLRNQRGFTLIEIIAVLVILGILAAVAIPRFMDMQRESANRALAGALAEGVSTVSMSYAAAVLEAGRDVSATAVAARANLNKPVSTDFSYNFARGTNESRVNVTVYWRAVRPPPANALDDTMRAVQIR